MKRPDLREYFKARIEYKRHGMLSVHRCILPLGIKSIDGDVDSRVITVTMHDGKIWKWEGGRYASRKIDGCYALLQPKPIRSEKG